MGKLAFAFVLVILLAGCSGKGTTQDSDTGNGTVATSGVISSHGGGPAGSNNPPTGSAAASVSSGMAPLTVVFTLDGKDKDNDPLSWTLDANGDHTSDKNGKTLPATVNFTYMSPGVFNVTYKLSDGKADVSFPLVVTVTPNVSSCVPLLSDGAEGDASLWAIASEVVINGNAPPAPPIPSGQPHPLGPWGQVTDQFHLGAKSWHAHYPDNYVSTMTLAKALGVPAGGATLSFWAKGGAEANGVDGLFVNVGADATHLENQIYQATVYGDWTQFSLKVPAGPLVVQFVFQSDVSCSSEPAPTGNAAACGAGYDAGGYWVDDILVA